MKEEGEGREATEEEGGRRRLLEGAGAAAEASEVEEGEVEESLAGSSSFTLLALLGFFLLSRSFSLFFVLFFPFGPSSSSPSSSMASSEAAARPCRRLLPELPRVRGTAAVAVSALASPPLAEAEWRWLPLSLPLLLAESPLSLLPSSLPSLSPLLPSSPPSPPSVFFLFTPLRFFPSLLFGYGRLLRFFGLGGGMCSFRPILFILMKYLTQAARERW